MACVWKHPQSKNWFARFTDASGKVVNRSTGETNRSKAAKVAEGWGRAARMARQGRLTRSRAKEVVDEILESIGVEAAPSITIDAMMGDWLADDVERSDATTARYKTTSRLFLESLGPRAKVPAAEVSTNDVQAYITGRARTQAAKTARNDLRCLSAAFSWGVRRGLLDRNPCLPVRPPEGASVERKPFEGEQVARLVEVAPNDEWRCLIGLCWFTGLRVGDASTLTWKEVDLHRRVIIRTQGKTGREVVVPIHPDLQTLLEKVAGDDPTGAVLPTLCRFRSGGSTGLSTTFQRIVLEAGIDEERQQCKGGKTLARYSLHSLRHGTVTSLANADIHPDVRQGIVGHADPASHQIYTHHSIEVRRKAVESIPSILKR